MSLRRYRLRAKHLKRKPKLIWSVGYNIRFLMSNKSARRKLKRKGGYFDEKTTREISQFIYIAPKQTKEDEYNWEEGCTLKHENAIGCPRILNDNWIANLKITEK